MTQRTLNAVIVCLLAIMLVSCGDDTTTTSVQVTINDPGVTTLQVGDSLTLSVNVTGDPSNRVTWRSSDVGLASVSPAGFVEARAAGTVRIIATSVLDPEQRDTVTFTITGNTPPDDPPPDDSSENQPPQVEAGTSLTGEVGSSTSISANASDPDGDTLTFAWNLSRPAGSGAVLEENTDTVTFTPDVAGTYSLELTVRDGEGGTATATWTVVVEASNVNPDSDLLCERQGYPCRLSDVPQDILTQSQAVLEAVADRANQGETLPDIATDLRDEPGMAEAAASNSTLRFRLEGGMPMSYHIVNDLVPTSTTTTLQLTNQKQGTGQLPSFKQAETLNNPIGQDRNGDGVVNQEDPRQVLLVAPLEWYFGDIAGDYDIFASITLLRGKFNNPLSSDDYFDIEIRTDDVDETSIAITTPELLEARIAAGFDLFQNWQAYDVIVLQTHGTPVCEGDTCFHTLMTGIEVESCDFTAKQQAVLDTIGMTCGRWEVETGPANNIVKEPRYNLELTADAFQRLYNGRMKNKVMYFAACYIAGSTNNVEEVREADIINAFGLEDSVYFAWDDRVSVEAGYQAANTLFTKLVSGGVTTRQAYQQVRQNNEHQEINSKGRLTTLQYFGTGNYRLRSKQQTSIEPGLRIREVVSLRQSGGSELEDDAVLSADALGGTVGDGQPDTLTLRALVEGATGSGDISTSAAGIDALDGFVLRFLVNDQMVGTPLALGQGTPDEVQIEPYDDPDSEREGYLVTYQDIPLEADASTLSVSADELRLESLGASLQLPEGGESRFKIEDICVGCGVWTVEQTDPIELGEGYDFTRAISSAANYQTAASRLYNVSIPGVGALTRLELTGENIEGNVNAVKQTWTLAPNFPHFIDVVFDSPQTLDGQYVTCAYSLFGQQTGDLTYTDEVVAEGVKGTLSLEGGFAGELSLYGDTNGNGICEFADIQIDTELAQFPVAAPGVNFFITFEGATVGE